jgi:hypothetical protein
MKSLWALFARGLLGCGFLSAYNASVHEIDDPIYLADHASVMSDHENGGGLFRSRCTSSVFDWAQSR